MSLLKVGVVFGNLLNGLIGVAAIIVASIVYFNMPDLGLATSLRVIAAVLVLASIGAVIAWTSFITAWREGELLLLARDIAYFHGIVMMAVGILVTVYNVSKLFGFVDWVAEGRKPVIVMTIIIGILLSIVGFLKETTPPYRKTPAQHFHGPPHGRLTEVRPQKNRPAPERLVSFGAGFSFRWQFGVFPAVRA